MLACRVTNILLSVLFMYIAGCDSIYHYVVFPPRRIEYTLQPSQKLLSLFRDSTAAVTIKEDGQTVLYDRKDFKIEIKYLTDYQLNTHEFPDQSQSGMYSTNPFTYGNWIDPELGYTPNRFTVFKVTIYNYAGSKINFDPENCFLYTDRGEELYCYSREEKNSRYQSLETYFKRRKGSTGIDDDVFESRMGIIRRTVHYFGKPVFRGDIREGLIVFDPLAEEVEHVKLVFKDFILGYDENNQASEFTSIQFYLDRIPFEVPVIVQHAADGTVRESSYLVKKLGSGQRPGGDLKILIKTTNVTPVQQLMMPLDKYLSEYTNFHVTFAKTTLLKKELESADILMIVADEGELAFTADQEKTVAEFITRGGFVVVDERSSTVQSENWSTINNFMTNVGHLLGSNVSFGRIPKDHQIFSVWKTFDALPPVDAELLSVEGRETQEFMSGITLENRLVAVISNRGYSVSWGEFGTAEIRLQKDFTQQREFLTNIFYYAIESAKKK